MSNDSGNEMEEIFSNLKETFKIQKSKSKREKEEDVEKVTHSRMEKNSIGLSLGKKIEEKHLPLVRPGGK